MSNSSQAAVTGLFSYSMRNAAPILFWSALIVFVLTIGAVVATYFFPAEIDQTDRATRMLLILNGFVQGVNNAVWPFIGAAIVSVLQKRNEGGAQ